MERLTVHFAPNVDPSGTMSDAEQASGVIRHGTEVDLTARVKELLESGFLLEEGSSDGPLTAEALQETTVPEVQERLDSGTWTVDDVERLEQDRENGPRVGVMNHVEKLRNSAE